MAVPKQLRVLREELADLITERFDRIDKALNIKPFARSKVTTFGATGDEQPSKNAGTNEEGKNAPDASIAEDGPEVTGTPDGDRSVGKNAPASPAATDVRGNVTTVPTAAEEAAKAKAEADAISADEQGTGKPKTSTKKPAADPTTPKPGSGEKNAPASLSSVPTQPHTGFGSTPSSSPSPQTGTQNPASAAPSPSDGNSGGSKVT